MELHLVDQDSIRQMMQIGEVIEAVEKAFTRLDAGQVNLPPVMSLDMPEIKGEVHVKGAHITGDTNLTIKIATGFYNNPLLGLPSGAGLMLVFSAQTGFPQAILLDNGYLTNLRTAAAGAIAAKYLARENLKTVGVVGAGEQGRLQVIALANVRKFNQVLIYDQNHDILEPYAEYIKQTLGVDCRPVNSVDQVVTGSDMVVTATPSTKPFIQADWIRPGLHITAVGADAPYKQELHSQVLSRADLLVCDLKTQCFERGELHHGLVDGTIGVGHPIVELGQLTSGKHPGRTGGSQVTICDLTGVGVQDAAIGSLCYQRTQEMKIGSRLAL